MAAWYDRPDELNQRLEDTAGEDCDGTTDYGDWQLIDPLAELARIERLAEEQTA